MGGAHVDGVLRGWGGVDCRAAVEESAFSTRPVVNIGGMLSCSE